MGLSLSVSLFLSALFLSFSLSLFSLSLFWSSLSFSRSSLSSLHWVQTQNPFVQRVSTLCDADGEAPQNGARKAGATQSFCGACLASGRSALTGCWRVGRVELLRPLAAVGGSIIRVRSGFLRPAGSSRVEEPRSPLQCRARQSSMHGT